MIHTEPKIPKNYVEISKEQARELPVGTKFYLTCTGRYRSVCEQMPCFLDSLVIWHKGAKKIKSPQTQCATPFKDDTNSHFYVPTVVPKGDISEINLMELL